MGPGHLANRAVLGQFGLLAMTWGASFLFIRISLQGLSPGQVVLARLVTGAVTLMAACAISNQPLPRAPVVWVHLTVLSVLMCVAPFLLFAWAEQRIASSLASVYNATTPLMTMLVALAALRQERATRGQFGGLLTGFAGVFVVLAPWRGITGGDITGQAACLLATGSYGLAFVYLRRFVSPHGLAAVPAATVQVGIGAAIMGLLAPLAATGPVRLTAPVVLSVLALGAAGTGMAYVWNNNIITAWGATNAATVTYLTPVVGVLLGMTVLNDALSWNEPLGALVVIVGIAISQERLRRTRSIQPQLATPLEERS